MLPLSAVDATLEDLLGLVRACQKHNIRGKNGTWNQFIQAHGQGAGADPKRQKKEVLEVFVADLLSADLDAPDDQVASPSGAAAAGPSIGAAADRPGAAGAPAGAGTDAGAAREFVQRYLKWAQQVRKDAAKGRGVLPLPIQQQPLLPEPSAAGSDPPQQTQQQRQAQGQQQQQRPLQPHVPAAEAPQQVSVWSLVHRTRAHPKYDSYYGNLPSYAPGWTRVKRARLSASVHPRLLALDCEMCATEEDESALLGVCVVDEFGGVVYRQLVRPPGRIRDLRTELTGVTEADLAGVTATAKDAQRAVRKLLEGGGGGRGGRAADGDGDGDGGGGGGGGGGMHRPVVLVGHSLHHDLAALRLDHQPVIDTALVFSFRDLPTCIPGLKDLALLLLGLQMRRGEGGVHDSREDASVAMRLVMRELQMAAPTPPLEPPRIKVPPADLAKLLAHSLPTGAGAASEAALRAAFAAAGAPPFERMEAGRDTKQNRQVLLVFRNAAVADEAFRKLPGRQDKDAIGRFCKRLVLGPEPGKSCVIRKMACHNGLYYGTGGGGNAAAATKPASKRPAKRARSEEKRGGGGRGGGRGGGGGGAESTGRAEQPHEAGGGGGVNDAATAAVAANGSARKPKRQKRGHGDGGGDGDPVKAAGKRQRSAEEGGGGGGAGPAAATAATLAAPVAAGRPDSQPKRKKLRRARRKEQAAAAAAASAAAIVASEGDGGRGTREVGERKRKRRETADGGGGTAGGGGGGGAAEGGGAEVEGKRQGKKARQDGSCS